MPKRIQDAKNKTSWQCLKLPCNLIDSSFDLPSLCASKSLNKYEINKNVFEKELLAIIG